MGSLGCWPRWLVWSWFYQLFDPWFFTKQKINDFGSSCIVIEEFNPFMHVENLLHEIGKLVNLVSYVTKKNDWLSAFGIFHNNSSLLELRGVWYPSMQYCNVIVLMRLVPGPPGIAWGGHSYFCYFD